MVIARQKPRQDRRLVVKPRPLPETLDLLQRDDFGAIDDARDAFEVIAAVAAEAILNVVADQLHANAPPPGACLVLQGVAGKPRPACERVGHDEHQGKRDGPGHSDDADGP